MNPCHDPIINAQTHRLRVGPWLVAPDINQISHDDGRTKRLEPKVVELLVLLAARAGEVTSREELLAALWPGVVVGDNSLTQAVIKLRRALGDTAREPLYIEAISKRGYRLIAPVQWPDGAQPTRRSVEAPVVRGNRAARPRPVRVGMLGFLVVTAAALLVVVTTRLFLQPARDEMIPARLSTMPRSLAARLPTVIVLPVEAIGGEAERLIARGLTADLINDLSKVSGLWVVSGAGPDSAKSRDGGSTTDPVAGHYLLTGNVQSDGRMLRLHVRLSDVDRGRQLWSQRTEREVRELFAVQDELVRSILEQLPIKVSQAELANIAHRYTRSVAAYEHFLRGQAALQTRRREQNDRARELYWAAIELDPAFSRAYAGLAMTYALAYQLGWQDESALGRAVELAGTAEQMSAGMPETHWVLGFVDTQRRRHDEAIRHLQNALRLNPSYADAYALMGGIRTYTGQPSDGVSLLRTALRLNPTAGSLYFLLLGRALYFVGDFEQARVNLEQALARNPESVETRLYLTAVLSRLGDLDAASWQAEEIGFIEPTFTSARWLATYPMTDGRQRERLAQDLKAFGL